MALLADYDTNLQTLTRHEEYYIPSGDLSILVEHVKFKVHKYFFERESQYFVGQLSTPSSPGTPLRGSGDDNALVLLDLTADDFAKFLWVFYNRKYSLYEADAEVWEIILTLASRWGFTEVKKLAIRELEKKELLDVKRIKLYQDNHVDPHYLISRYAALCSRDEPLTLEEGRALGMETTLMIARGREEARASRTASGARSPLTPTIQGADLHEFIRELFQISADSTEVKGPNIPGALPQPRTEPPATATATTTDTPLTLTPTQKTPPATQSQTPTKTAAQATKAKKANQTGSQQQTKATPKPGTSVQETKLPPTLLKDPKTTAQIKEEANNKTNAAVTATPAAAADGTVSTTPPDSTSPLHIITDTTTTGAAADITKPISSIFDNLWSSPAKEKGSVPSSVFGGVSTLIDLDPSTIT